MDGLSITGTPQIPPEVQQMMQSPSWEQIKAVMADDMASLTDKCKVIDRAINIEKLKQKISDDEWGSGFIATDDE